MKNLIFLFCCSLLFLLGCEDVILPVSEKNIASCSMLELVYFRFDLNIDEAYASNLSTEEIDVSVDIKRGNEWDNVFAARLRKKGEGGDAALKKPAGMQEDSEFRLKIRKMAWQEPRIGYVKLARDQEGQLQALSVDSL